MKKVFIIAGPTASGKTALAIKLAKKLGTEIISADSRQCYKEMKIGVARPSDEELKQVNHHFIATHSIHEKVTAATFEQYALSKAEEIFKHHDALVMVGGTGLYIKAFTEGLDDIPEVPDTIREQIEQDHALHGITWLKATVEKEDPAYFQKGEIHNPQRLMRALEVMRTTGRSITAFRTGKTKKRPFSVDAYVIDIDKDDLHRNIANRVDEMMEHGLEAEVRSLIPYQHLNALQTVGYRELFDHFNGERSLQDAVEAIKMNTRRYAKRQLTWFRKMPGYKWIRPEVSAIIPHHS